MKSKEEILKGVINPVCGCHEIYKSRKMIDPDCVHCNYWEYTLEVMEEYAQQFKDGPQWISVDNDYPECAAGERNYSINVEAKFPDGNTCKGHFELEDGYFYDGDTLCQYSQKPTHWRSLSSTAESGQRTPADDAVEFHKWVIDNGDKLDKEAGMPHSPEQFYQLFKGE